MGFETLTGERRRSAVVAPGGEECVLRQSIAGKERLAAEAARRKCVGKGVQCVGADRLRAIEGRAPGRKVEPFALRRRHAFHTEAVAEVRGAAERSAVAG